MAHELPRPKNEPPKTRYGLCAFCQKWSPLPVGSTLLDCRYCGERGQAVGTSTVLDNVEPKLMSDR